MLRWRSYPVLIAAVLMLSLALSRCGKESDDADEGTPKPAVGGSGSETGGGTTGTAAQSPTGWDGLTDWNGSDWEVVDE